MPLVSNPITPTLSVSELRALANRHPLPPIADAQFAKSVTVRTTRPLRAGKTPQHSLPEIDFQLLEALGDGLLEACICRVLYANVKSRADGSAKLFSVSRARVILTAVQGLEWLTMVCSPTQAYRAALRDNGMLAQLSHGYRLYLTMPPPLDPASTAAGAPFSVSVTKILADSFEAYIGGLTQGSGEEVARTWLEPLLTDLMRLIYPSVEGPDAVSRVEWRVYVGEFAVQR